MIHQLRKKIKKGMSLGSCLSSWSILCFVRFLFLKKIIFFIFKYFYYNYNCNKIVHKNVVNDQYTTPINYKFKFFHQWAMRQVILNLNLPCYNITCQLYIQPFSMHAINYGCGLSLNTIFSDELKPFMLTRGLNIAIRNSFTGKHLES
jgi:hypothetical protein